jgi:hypothetical protein
MPPEAVPVDLYAEEILRARDMTPEEKILAGPRLFEFACRITADGIRAQFPDASPTELRQILSERLALGKRLESMF